MLVPTHLSPISGQSRFTPNPCEDGYAPDPNANYSEVPEAEVLPLDLPEPIDTGSAQAQCKMLGESTNNNKK